MRFSRSEAVFRYFSAVFQNFPLKPKVPYRNVYCLRKIAALGSTITLNSDSTKIQNSLSLALEHKKDVSFVIGKV